MNTELLKDIDTFVTENEDNIFRDIARLVAINSVEGERGENEPFGPGPAAVLGLGLEIAGELGLETKNCENYIGYATVGRGEKYISTITHLDVVPTGDGWSEDPFTMREREGYIIGRGVLDDKGPSVVCLYALKYLKDKNIPLNYEVRALLGTNEERGMGDVIYYLNNYQAPAFCFSPDADFPVCNGEKGIYGGRITANFENENILEIQGGFSTNAVCDKCTALVKAEGLEGTEEVEVFEENDLWRITAHGIGGHAAMPKGTKNAIGVMADYILENKIASEKEAAFLKLISKLHHDYSGKLLGIDADDGLFDPLTIVGGMIGMENGRMWQSLDSRYPTNTDGERITAGIQAEAGAIAHVETVRCTEPFYISADNPAVKICIDAYNSVTGENAKPFTMGGGTYARDFPNAVSFGPEHPERKMPDWAGPIHGIDETASKAYLLEALKIYIVALIELQKLEF